MTDPLQTKFLIAPITTRLQRVARDDAQALVVVDMADDELVDFKELRNSLAAWPGRALGRVFFSIRHGLPSGQTSEQVGGEPFPLPVLFNQAELVRLAFEGLARDVGFPGATVDAYLPWPRRCAWEKLVADFVDHADEDATAEESPSGDNLVEVYPIRTALSRFENLSADYAVRIVPPVDELNPADATKLPTAIEAHLSRINPDRSGKVACLVTANQGGPRTDKGFDLLLNNRFWCDQLGFELAGWRQI